MAEVCKCGDAALEHTAALSALSCGNSLQTVAIIRSHSKDGSIRFFRDFKDNELW